MSTLNGQELAEKLKRHMVEHGLKQIDVARESGVKYATVGRLLRGDTVSLAYEHADTLCRYLGIDNAETEEMTDLTIPTRRVESLATVLREATDGKVPAKILKSVLFSEGQFLLDLSKGILQ